jgi:hypothetical protein
MATRFPANVFIASIDHSSFHWHLDYELILVLKGTILLTEGTKTIVLKGGDVYLINTKSIHALGGQGTHCGHSDYLLNKVLKDEWGFDGFVISDFGYGIRETVEAANGGQNIEMSFTNHFGEPLIKVVKEGKGISVPYGYGLSYTSFVFSNPLFSTDGTSVTASCDICNSGKREGAEVVQMYVGFLNSRIDRPLKTLTGFRRVALRPGETKRVEITCSMDELCWYNEEAGRMELECMEYEVYIGKSSAAGNLLKGNITISTSTGISPSRE